MRQKARNILSQLSFLFGEKQEEVAPSAPAPRPEAPPRPSQLPLLPLPEAPEPKPEPAQAAGAETPEQRAFAELLARYTRMSWHIHWTRNRRTMISFSSRHRPPLLRLQGFFVEAPPSVAGRIAEVIEGRKRSWGAEVDQFIRTQLSNPKWRETLAKAREVALSPQGKRLDLVPLFEELNARYFDSRVIAKLGFMRAVAPKRGRNISMKLGTYSPESGIIRLHPALESEKVPLFVVEAVLFHEMAHALQPSLHQAPKGQRRAVHDKAFKTELTRFPQTAEADLWIKNNLRQLLSDWSKTHKKSRKP